MNILFLYPSINPNKGGIERVTYVLSKYLKSQGLNCFYLGLKQKNDMPEEEMNYLPDMSNEFTDTNRNFFLSFIKDNSIDVVINQGGMYGSKASLLSFEARKVGVKVINCIHNSLLDGYRHLDVTYSSRISKYKLDWAKKYISSKSFKKFIVFLIKMRTRNYYRQLVKNSDAVVLLSDSFKPDLQAITKMTCDNVFSISNPLSYKLDCDINNKSKTVLYVGRINTAQKKVDLLLNIWAKICHNHLDWNLKIVGYGIETENLKTKAKELNLVNYSFEGKKDPRNYYKEASIFTMTSAYEGFGIVLTEAMQYGVVPIAFDSFASVHDIIDKNCGVLVKPFDLDMYAEAIDSLMLNPTLLHKMSSSVRRKSESFTLEKIGKKWIELFKILN